MPKKIETKEINGYSYTVTQMGGVRSRRVATRLLRVAGAAFAGVLSAGGSANRVDALKGVLESVTDENMEYFYKEFAADTTVTIPEEDPEKPARVAYLKNEAAFDDVFTGRVVDMFQWLVFAFEVNYGSFLAGDNPLVREMSEKLGLAKKSNPPSSEKQPAP